MCTSALVLNAEDFFGAMTHGESSGERLKTDTLQSIDFHGKRFIEVDEKYLRARKRRKITLASCASSMFRSLPRPSAAVPLSSSKRSPSCGTQTNKEFLEVCSALSSDPPRMASTSHQDKELAQVSDEESTDGSLHLVEDPHKLLLEDIHPLDEPVAVELLPEAVFTNYPVVDKKMERRASDPLPSAEKIKQDRRHSLPVNTSPPEYATEKCLGADFIPGNWDVVCGRGKKWVEHVSNRRFRVLVAMHIKEYFETKSRARKSMVINAIVTTIQTSSGEGFVRKRGNVWYRITTKEAREKVSHCLRDCLVDSQHEQMKWSKDQQEDKLKEAQNHVFESLGLMQ